MKTLCIIGGGVTRMKAPYCDQSVEIWSTVSVGQELPRVDVCFELHDGVYGPDVLNRLGCKVYMKEKSKDVPKSERFPIEELLKEYGKRLNGTVVDMLAMAGLLGYKTVKLYGIDMSSDEEYNRRNFFYFIMGWLTGQGVKIGICPGGYLEDECPTYMYEDDGKAYIGDMMAKAHDRLVEAEKDIFEATQTKCYMRGMVDTLNRIGRR